MVAWKSKRLARTQYFETTPLRTADIESVTAPIENQIALLIQELETRASKAQIDGVTDLILALEQSLTEEINTP